MITLSYNEVDGFVRRLQRSGVKVRWDGWNMVFFKPDRRAIRKVKGRRLGDLWGFETVVKPNRDGRWVVDRELARVNTVGA